MHFFNDFFFFMQHATVYNFTEDNTLSSFTKTFDKLKEILESESTFCPILIIVRQVGLFLIPPL